MEDKVRFRDLNGWLKFGMIGAWIITILYAIVFLFGFFSVL